MTLLAIFFCALMFIASVWIAGVVLYLLMLGLRKVIGALGRVGRGE